jgi:hypothetical protein
MSHVFRYNFFGRRPQAPRKFPRPWVRDDIRPRCVVVLGDGFTQSFLSHYGLATVVPSRIGAHFPAPADKPYFPLPGDRFCPSALWDEAKWPQLIASWRAYGRPDDPYGFYQFCAGERINPDLAAGLWTFRTSTLAYQLRAYLWHYFVSFQAVLEHEFRSRGFEQMSWPWTRILKLLDADFRLSIVTFNYDLVCHNVLWVFLQGNRLWCSVEMADPPLDEWPAKTVPLLQAHGGINEFLVFPPMLARHSSTNNPWLEDFVCQGNLSQGSITRFCPPHTEPFNYFPLALSLVPPGHQGDDVCDPHSRVAAMSNMLLGAADVVIFCGLSASPPDTFEVAGFVYAVRAGALTVQVGITGHDEDNPLATLLTASKAGRTVFLDAGELLRLRDHLAGRFPLTTPAWDDLCV